MNGLNTNGTEFDLKWSMVTIQRLAHLFILNTSTSGAKSKNVYSWPVRTPDSVHKCYWRATLSSEKRRLAVHNGKSLKVSLTLQSDDPKPRVTRHHIRGTIFTSKEHFTQSFLNNTRHRIDLYSSCVQQSGWTLQMSSLTMSRVIHNNQVALLAEVYLTNSRFSSEWDKEKDQVWPVATLPDIAIPLAKRRWRVSSWLQRHSPDVILVCSGSLELATHRTLLVAESRVFQAIMHYNGTEGGTRVPIEQDVSTMKLLLYFFRQGCLPSLGPEFDFATLMSAADMYQLDRLLAALHQCLLERLTPQTSSTIVKLANLYHCPRLVRIASQTQAVSNPNFKLQSLLDADRSLTSRLQTLSIEYTETQLQRRAVRVQLKHLFNVML